MGMIIGAKCGRCWEKIENCTCNSGHAKRRSETIGLTEGRTRDGMEFPIGSEPTNTCNKCRSWTGNKHHGKFKCYCGKCPAKIRDEKIRRRGGRP